MSYDMRLLDGKGVEYSLREPLKDGGTFLAGGNVSTTLNVTYNYSWFYYEFLDGEKGLRFLSGKKAGEVLPLLKKIVKRFDRHKPYKKDYWADTLGNCLQPLRVFMEWAEDHPEGMFELSV